eukprot:1159581-Pelagomonas_calceolata.AAC.3
MASNDMRNEDMLKQRLLRLPSSNCETLRNFLEGPEGRFALALQGPLMLDCSDPGWLPRIAAL